MAVATCLDTKQIIEIFNIMESSIAHEIAIEACEHEGEQLNFAEIPVPSLGKIKVYIKKGKVVDTKIELYNELKDDIEIAVTTGESKLIKMAEQKMINKIKAKYNALA